MAPIPRMAIRPPEECALTGSGSADGDEDTDLLTTGMVSRGEGASSSNRCALMPPKPKALTAARRGAPERLDHRSLPWGILKGEESRSMPSGGES